MKGDKKVVKEQVEEGRRGCEVGRLLRIMRRWMRRQRKIGRERRCRKRRLRRIK